MLRCEEIEVRRRYRLLILYVDIVDHSIAVNIEKLTRVTAPAASCPLGPAHAGIKMRTHQHTIHCSPAPSSWSGERRQASFWSREKLQLQLLLHAAAAPVYSPAAQPRVTAARHGQMLQLPGRGGAGRGHQGEGRTVTISSALDWPPAYTGHPPPRRPGFIGAVFSRAACNPRLGRAADCHTMGPWVTSWPRSRVTCHAVPILAPAPH